MIRLRTLLPIVCVTITAGCGGSAATPQDSGSEARTVAVVQSQRRDVVQSITLPGDLVGFYEAALHSKVTGYLRKIDVDKGDWVKQGQVLATIEVPELDQNLARARAQLDIARITWERLDRVRTSDPKLVAKEDVDIAYSKYMEAKASTGELETMVGYTQIIAPFDGVITGRFADPGALIRAGGGDLGISGSGVNVSAAALEGAGGHLTGGGPILSEARIDKLRVYIYVPESEAGYVKVGQPATITLRAFPGQKFPVTVTRFASSLDLATRTMLTELDIPNPDHRLYPRMYADVALVLIDHPNAIEVPRGAVYGFGEPDTWLFTVVNSHLQKTAVTTGISDGTNVEITSGLGGGETVVSTLNASLTAGDAVRTLDETPGAQSPQASASAD
ncbi:MAG: efflux RND transporter periplasmic adaptor subunit [Candidatus Binataceae bacterium]